MKSRVAQRSLWRTGSWWFEHLLPLLGNNLDQFLNHNVLPWPGDINDKLTWICFMIGWCSLSGLRATSKDIRIQTVQPTCTLSNHEYMKTIPKCPFQAVPTALLCLPSADKNRRHTSWILMLPIIPKLWILEDSDYKSQLVTAWVYRSLGGFRALEGALWFSLSIWVFPTEISSLQI